jgi:cellobiose phosphorylase
MRKQFEITGWEFMNDDGDFRLENPQNSNYLYFPLANMSGMMSSVTPALGGDVKSGQNTFLMAPVSSEDLHNSRISRNFWVYAEGRGVWSATGRSASQLCGENEKAIMEAGLLWHRVIRENPDLGLKSEITNFVPASGGKVELMRVVITNTGGEDVRITPTAAVPIYGRSADNIRDHRHVTSLLHRICASEYGVEVRPVLSFDERGHKVNNVLYGVLGADQDGGAPVGMFPVIEDFIGEGGNLEWPLSVVRNQAPVARSGDRFEGYEAIGALRFKDRYLKPGESAAYIILLGIAETGEEQANWAEYLSIPRFEKEFDENRRWWKEKISTCAFKSGDPDFDRWMKWVAAQPILRRIFGCSFLPHHDYGRGGRGWRDLWQDCLALLVMDPGEVRSLLYNNYAGVRMDGSNATIIGSKPGEFLADRNNIPRVWMDHGAWPFLTTMLYLDLSGDLGFLLEKQCYFKDSLTHRAKRRDESWTPDQGCMQRDRTGMVYEGSLLEHIILQNVVQFFNTGEHNNIRLEGADWNDALDMAAQRGESVAFTALYGYNLREIGRLLRALEDRLGIKTLEFASEIVRLFDTLGDPVDYDSTKDKNALLQSYFDSCSGLLSGNRTGIPVAQLAADLEKKADWIFGHIRRSEWIQEKDGLSWFNGYYDNEGRRVEGGHPEGIRMTLTGQVFTIMGGIASDEQAKQAAKAVKAVLKDERIGYRLNSRFGGLQLSLGRAFGFAFGHKENGAMFSHMAVMYANALIKRGLVAEGCDVLDSIYRLCSDFENSRIYPGIPEYINERGRGMYHYLTGSASWLLLTVLTEVYGVKGRLGDLMLEPKLLKGWFDGDGQASVRTIFAGRDIIVTYLNPQGKEYGEYAVRRISINGEAIGFESVKGGAVISRGRIEGLEAGEMSRIEVLLG